MGLFIFFRSNLIRYGVTNVVKISHHLSCCHVLIPSRVCDSYSPQVFVDLVMIRIVFTCIRRSNNTRGRGRTIVHRSTCDTYREAISSTLITLNRYGRQIFVDNMPIRIIFFFDYVSSVLLMFIVDNEIDENNKE